MITDVELAFFQQKDAEGNVVRSTLHWRKKFVTSVYADDYGKHEVHVWSDWRPVPSVDAPPEPPPECPASPSYVPGR
jgi:hypothetical protein